MGDLVFIGDAHLDRDGRHLDAFLAFLDRLAETSSRIVFMGDLFNLWIGRRELEQPHQTAVVEKLEELRRRGAVVRYVEGNRDYRIGQGYVGDALDEATDSGLSESFGGKRLFAIHGDLANPRDRPYRTWRRFSRSAVVWGLFNLMPRRRRLRWAESLETRLRASNLDFKRELPEDDIRTYATSFLESGSDVVLLGHFHAEKDLLVETGRGSGRILVLPLWTESRRHVRVTTSGDVGFVDSD